MKDLTPKYKAKELIDKFWNVELAYYECKQCALIAVDNEIKSIMWLNVLCINDNYMKEHLNQKVKELQEVEQEIKNL